MPRPGCRKKRIGTEPGALRPQQEMPVEGYSVVEGYWYEQSYYQWAIRVAEASFYCWQEQWVQGKELITCACTKALALAATGNGPGESSL